MFFLYQTHPWRSCLSEKPTVLVHVRDGITQKNDLTAHFERKLFFQGGRNLWGFMSMF